MARRAADYIEDQNETYDPLYGPIRLTDLERDLLLTPPFIRARSIKQIGTAAYFKNVPHTRFMHCLGVMHLVDLALRGLFPDGIPYLEIKTPDMSVELEPRKAHQTIRAAALLHDIGHGPMSHVFESFVERKPEAYWKSLWMDFGQSKHAAAAPGHEDVSEYLIAKPDGPISEALRAHHIEPALVAALVGGKADTFPYRDIGHLVHGDVDMDRLDYSMRDTYYLGEAGASLGYDLFDYERLIDCLTIIDVSGANGVEPYLAFDDREGVGLLNQFFALRSRFMAEIPRNRSIRTADLHFVRALQLAEAHQGWTHKEVSTVMTEWSDQKLANVLLDSEGCCELMKRIMSGEDAFGPSRTYRVDEFPASIRYSLVCQAYDRRYTLEEILTDDLAASLGSAAGDPKVLVGLNIPSEIPSVRISVEPETEDDSDCEPVDGAVTRWYLDRSPYAQAFAEEAFSAAELLVCAPELGHEYAEQFREFMDARFVLPDCDRTSGRARESTLHSMLESARERVPAKGRRSSRLDLVLLSVLALTAVSAEHLHLKPKTTTRNLNRVGAGPLDALWVRGAGGFNRYMYQVQSDLGWEFPYAFQTPYLSRELARDVFLLAQSGMLRAFRVRVPRRVGPASVRVDCQLSNHGRAHCRALLNDKLIKTQFTEQLRWVRERQVQNATVEALSVAYILDTDPVATDAVTRPDVTVSADVGSTF